MLNLKCQPNAYSSGIKITYHWDSLIMTISNNLNLISVGYCKTLSPVAQLVIKFIYIFQHYCFRFSETFCWCSFRLKRSENITSRIYKLYKFIILYNITMNIKLSEWNLHFNTISMSICIPKYFRIISGWQLKMSSKIIPLLFSLLTMLTLYSMGMWSTLAEILFRKGQRSSYTNRKVMQGHYIPSYTLD